MISMYESCKQNRYEMGLFPVNVVNVNNLSSVEKPKQKRRVDLTPRSCNAILFSA